LKDLLNKEIIVATIPPFCRMTEYLRKFILQQITSCVKTTADETGAAENLK